MASSQFQLLQRLKSKESAAYQELVEEFGNKLLRLAFMVVGDQNIAEDVVQEVFLSLYNNLETFRGDSLLSTWLTRVTINKAKNTIRPKWFQRVSIGMDFEVKYDGKEPQEAFEHKEEVEIVRDVLQKLPLKYRDVLYLYYYEELKVKEIAEIIETGESGVKTRLSRGRDMLKQLLSERGLG